MKILLIEDDDVFIKILTKTLKAHHYIVDAVKDGEAGWTYGSTFDYDLMVMDVVLPKLDGISLCKRFRAERYTTPILLLTSQDSSPSRIQGLDAGADDYVVKPFEPTELMARIRALLRRSSSNPFPLLTWGDLMLNSSTCEVSYGGQLLALTTKEYELLELMMRDSQHVFSTDELLDHLWSSEKFPSEATVRSHIRRVRHKLAAIGAPPDLIATLHGRGYYLKAFQANAGTLEERSPQQLLYPDASATGKALTEMDTIPADSPSPDAQHQYLAFLNDIWTTTKHHSLDQVAVLSKTVQALQADQLTPQHQDQSQQLAHKLAGTLSIFGLPKAVHLARQLDHWLGSQDLLQSNQAALMNHVVIALQQAIQATTQIQLSQIPNGHSPLLLLVSTDDGLNQSLKAIALSRGIRVEVVSPLDLENTLIDPSAIHASDRPPQVVVLCLPASLDVRQTEEVRQTERFESHSPWQSLQSCTQRFPEVPIVVMGDCIELRDRLAVVQHGGKLFLHRSTPPEQIIAAAVDLLRGSHLPIKVMVVDDDRYWLGTLPTLLKPWGFKVTTLAEPQQFWTVLQAVMPDVLVLDATMPDINGFELCQILRSAPHWQRLPVLFLSVLTDSTSQQQAFTVGADDYLCKPLTGGELATRILNRLQRVQAWAS